MKPLVSVIVPIYNVESTLKRCLDSLCKQSLHDIEIILVNDSSSDRSGSICEEYVAKDARFKVIHHSQNRGLAAARNTGVASAISDYLMFVDSDDWVHRDFCKYPYECAVRYQADLIMFKYLKIGIFCFFEPSVLVNEDSIMCDYKTRWQAINLLLKSIGSYAWNKLYRKELFNDVLYPEGYYYEDVGTTYKIVLKARRIYYLDKELYYYYARNSSITFSKSEKVLNDWLVMFMRRYRDLIVMGYPSEELNQSLNNFALAYCIRKKRDMFNHNYVFFATTLSSIKGVPDEFVWKRKLLFILYKYYPSLFELVCTLWGKKVC